jgi:hypothetical protein
MLVILHNLNSTAVNGDMFIKNLQGGTFAFEHLYLQISDSNIPYDVLWVRIAYGIEIRPTNG